VPVYSAVNTGVVPTRAGHRHALIAPYGLYELSDGSSVMVVVQSNPEWASFAEHVLGDASLVDDARFADNQDRIGNIAELEAEIHAVFGTETPDDVVARLERGRIAWARARTPIEVWEHEQLVARDRFMSVAIPGGETTMFKPPFNISGVTDPTPTVPALGEHDPALVADLLRRSDDAPG
jgi:crotonobetainyl-CoA:carnitine CoA-transferase CaiB-like acyl-CoA transferase